MNVAGIILEWNFSGKMVMRGILFTWYFPTFYEFGDVIVSDKKTVVFQIAASLINLSR